LSISKGASLREGRVTRQVTDEFSMFQSGSQKALRDTTINITDPEIFANTKWSAKT